MHRVRLLTMELGDPSLGRTMTELGVIRDPENKSPHEEWPEYDYYGPEGALRNLIAEHWAGDEDHGIERVAEFPNHDLAAAAAAEMLSEAEVDDIGLTPADVFDRWCDWQGLIHWGPRLREAMANLLGREEL